MRRPQRNLLMWGVGVAIAAVPLFQSLLLPRPNLSQSAVTNSCIGSSNPADAEIAWSKLKNPIVQFDNYAAKDMTVRLVNGTWTMMVSYIADNPFRFRIGIIQSRDWANWSTQDVKTWDSWKSGGLASPDLTQLPDGTYVTVFNSHSYDKQVSNDTYQNKLYYRTSKDLQTWSELKPLVSNLWNGRDDRLIDAALAPTPIGLVAGLKRSSSFQLAVSPSGSLDGPWQEIGQPDIPGGLENYQFLQIDGVWHLLGTTLNKPRGYNRVHMPALYQIDGAPNKLESWLNWKQVGILDVPQEDWNGGDREDNKYERANSAYLCDARAVDGYFYLFYAGSNEGKRFNRRGHAKIGVARSRDLKQWQVP